MAQIIKKSLIQLEKTQVCFEANEPLEPLLNTEQVALLEQERFEEGYLKGKEEASQLWHQELNELKTCLEQLLDSIPKAVEQNRLAMQKELSPICLMIIQRYFIAQSVEPQALATQINQLLVQINNQHAIELHLNARDIQLLQQGDIQLTAVKNEVTVKHNDSLALGGFIIKTPHGLFEFNIAKQIDQLKSHLLELREEQSS